MATWPPKDPDAVFDYLYTIPLDEGDTVASSNFTRLSGTVNIDSSSRTDAEWTVELSGGADGETTVFHVDWVTAGGREDDDFITIAVVSNDPLVLTGYAKPTPGHLITRYPAFADVPTTTILYWLTDAERYVTTAWTEGDYAAGLMALAAHNMSLAGYGTEATTLSGIPAGITRMKSGTLELGFTDAAANARMSGSFGSTRYGEEYKALLARNRGGPRVTPTGAIPIGVYPQVWP